MRASLKLKSQMGGGGEAGFTLENFTLKLQTGWGWVEVLLRDDSHCSFR
jgi:hypothetical protein